MWATFKLHFPNELLRLHCQNEATIYIENALVRSLRFIRLLNNQIGDQIGGGHITT